MDTQGEVSLSRDWKERLSVSRDLVPDLLLRAENLRGHYMNGL